MAAKDITPDIKPPKTAIKYPFKLLDSLTFSVTFLCHLVVKTPATTNSDMKNNEKDATKLKIMIGLKMNKFKDCRACVFQISQTHLSTRNT